MVDPREKIKKLGVELYDHYRLNDWSLTERVFCEGGGEGGKDI